MRRETKRAVSIPRRLLRALGCLLVLSWAAVAALGPASATRAAPEPAGGPEQAQVSEPVRVYLHPSVVSMSHCGLIELTVQVQAVSGLWGVQYAILFDPNLLEVVDADPAKAGVQIYPAEVFAERATYEARNNADNAAGRILYAVTMINPRDEPFYGSGGLGRIRFRPKTSGPLATTVRFEEGQCSLANRNASPIPATWGSATITCGQRSLFLPLVMRNRRMGG